MTSPWNSNEVTPKDDYLKSLIVSLADRQDKRPFTVLGTLSRTGRNNLLRLNAC